MPQIVEHLTVMFQKLQRQISGRIVLGDMFISLEVFLDMCDTVFYFMAIVDMQVTCSLACTLIYLNDSLEELLYSITILKLCGYHRHTKQLAQCLDVNIVASSLKLIIHVQGTNHTYVHIHQLSGEIEVTFKI